MTIRDIYLLIFQEIKLRKYTYCKNNEFKGFLLCSKLSFLNDRAALTSSKGNILLTFHSKLTVTDLSP